ncbi:MAG: DeoR family transcriptional regulator [Dehalococcoidia bacterium]|nr:DeoR family transcriptional regulator [Dehalococcoidia bacterium]
MQTTKQQLLTLLKRTGSITVEEAAGALAVASMTARQHLVNLERDGLIQSEPVRRSNGRPHYLYTLTPKGEEMFPRRYDLLAQVILDEVGALSPGDIASLTAEEKRSLLIRRTADRLAERYRFQVEGRSLPERVAAVTDVLQLIGGFAEWLPLDSGYEIRDYNCVFARLIAAPPDLSQTSEADDTAAKEASGCEWHVRLLTQLLQSPVQHERAVDGRVECCRYLVGVEVLAGEPQGVLTNA